MSIWNNLRSWHGDQSSAFEELCCQLAYAEKVTGNSEYFRKGRPDAGIECYWKMQTGDEWGWQAKYFRQAMGNSQWSQLNESFETAFTSHPKLNKYFVCLPQNLSDARLKGRKSSAAKWDELKAGWLAKAQEAGRELSVVLWNETELLKRLNQDDKQGMFWFWFDGEQRFSTRWFQERLEEAIVTAGERYTPEANLDLPISKTFVGLGRCKEYFDQVELLIAKMHEKHRGLDRRVAQELLSSSYSEADTHFIELSNLLHSLIQSTSSWQKHIALIPVETISDLARETSQRLTRISSSLDQLRRAREQEKQKGENRSLYSDPIIDSLRGASFKAADLRNALDNVIYFFQSDSTSLLNNPAMLLAGQAGSGKTHLLCDVAKKDLSNGRPRLLFYGSHFRDAEPFSQMIALLGLNCTIDQFLGGLSASAQANSSRILIFVDAINEGQGNVLWAKHLASFLKRLKRYPYLGVCLSVRSSYQDLVLPEDLPADVFTEVQHHGFEEHETEAVARYFAQYQIIPSYPMLVPEFSSPLFLKLFCTALRNHELRDVPLGIRGITSLVEFFLQSVNKKLSKREYLDLNPYDRVVQKAVDRLCTLLADSGREFLLRQEAENCVNDLHPTTGYSNSLFALLIHEGVINLDRWWLEGKMHEVVQFSYQRFADHLIAKNLLDRYLDPTDPTKAFRKKGPLHSLVKDDDAVFERIGLIEAFSVQLPERTQKEFWELAPHLTQSQPVANAFIESIVWRSVKAFSSGTQSFVERLISEEPYLTGKLLNAFITVAPIPNHPYNSDALHTRLYPITLPERDTWWNPFLHNQQQQPGAVRRLVDWSLAKSTKRNFDSEVIRLTATALTWFLASSNRYLRDQTTKALVRLLEERIGVLTQVLTSFRDVNDPYVVERLMAVVYGVAMRSRDKEALNALALSIFEFTLKGENIPVHIRTRDYISGTIELAINSGVNLPFDASLFRPPFRTNLNLKRLPSIKLLQKQLTGGAKGEVNFAVDDLVSSTTSTYADFRRYVIGDLREWSNCLLTEEPQKNRRALYNSFRTSLTPLQLEAFAIFRRLRNVSVEQLQTLLEGEFSEEELHQAQQQSEDVLRSRLRRGSKKEKELDLHVLPYIDEPIIERHFDAEAAARWILRRVTQLGWTATRFGVFDRAMSRYDSRRTAHKAERIGKKYQWIAYCELLARIADNYRLNSDQSEAPNYTLRGAWQLSRGRDIDPSMLCSKVNRNNWATSTPCWWFHEYPMSWETTPNHLEWLKNTTDLPIPSTLIQVTKPEDGSEWLNLYSHYSWEEPVPAHMDRHDVTKRQIEYWLRSYIIRKSDSKSFFKWLSRQFLESSLIDQHHEDTTLFLGEFFRSPAYHDTDNSYNGRPGWTNDDHDRMPAMLLATSETYMQESGAADCSIESTVLMQLPVKQIVEGMKLSWFGKESEFVDSFDDVVVFDPSVHEQGPASLLIRRKEFLKYLEDAGLEILWTLTGNKHQTGGWRLHQQYLGHTDVSAYYHIVDGKVVGDFKTRFKSREDRDSVKAKRSSKSK